MIEAAKTPVATPGLDQRHRFPGKMISPDVWTLHRCRASQHEVEELLFGRHIILPYASSRK